MYDPKFDERVRDRRDHTPWANISFQSFARDMARQGRQWEKEFAREAGEDPETFAPVRQGFVLVIEECTQNRSGFRFTVKWTGADGRRFSQSAQYFDLCLWQAVEREMQVIKEIAGREEEARTV